LGVAICIPEKVQEELVKTLSPVAVSASPFSRNPVLAAS
jgi:hypothetical protein